MIVMQRKQRVARNYRRLSPEKKVLFFLKIYGKMSATGSPFTNTSLIYTYALGLIAINAITGALMAAGSGGHGVADAVAKAVAAAEMFIDKWAEIVEMIADYDPVIIASSGFTPTKGETTPAAINGQPGLDFTPQKQAGTVKLSVNVRSITVENPTITYIIGSNLSTLVRSGDLMHCSDPAVQLFIINGKKDVMVTGLPSGIDLQCVCVITNTAGVSMYSNLIRFKLQ